MQVGQTSLNKPTSPAARWPALVLAAGVAALAAADPRLALGAAAGVLFLALFFFRREWLVAALFIFFLFQDLLVKRLTPINEALATLVKQGDDVLIVFFYGALLTEALVPVLRLNQIPHGGLFAGLLAVCILSAVVQGLSARETAVGLYVMFKNFVFFFLAASVRLDLRGYTRAWRFLLAVLGAVMAFAFFQFLTGDLTYNLLGLPKDHRLGIVRVRSIFTHPVFLGQTMSLLTVLCVSMYVYSPRLIYLVIAAAALVAVGLTMLVKTIVALGLVVGVVLLRKRPWLLLPYALAGALAMVNLGEYGMENVRQQFATYIESPRSVRREGYRICGEILLESPLLGCGPGRFGGYAATLLDSPVAMQHGFINYDFDEYSSIDCHWPHLMAEIGLVGGVMYLALLAAMGRASLRLSKRDDLPVHTRAMAMAAAVYLLAAVIEAFAVSNFEDTFCGFMIFAMLGLTQGVHLKEKAESVHRELLGSADEGGE